MYWFKLYEIRQTNNDTCYKPIEDCLEEVNRHVLIWFLQLLTLNKTKKYNKYNLDTFTLMTKISKTDLFCDLHTFSKEYRVFGLWRGPPYWK